MRRRERDLHSTSRMILLLTLGGIPLLAMHKYAAESVRLIFEMMSSSPSWAMLTKRPPPPPIISADELSEFIFHLPRVINLNLPVRFGDDARAVSVVVVVCCCCCGGCLLSISSRPSSRFQLTRAAGTPRARQMRDTRAPSLTESCDGELSESTMEGGTG